jgi:DeoR/GlpR family transcriptional regulator of sugar metabolism
MRREDRLQAIVEDLISQGMVTLDALADRFDVSKMTIHRDLDDLEQEGVLRKVRGGATIEAGTQFQSDFSIRERQDGAAKARLAEAALALVEPGMTVMVNDGSMAALLGARLAEKRPVTVITNNAAVYDRLKSAPGVTLIVLGGTYSPRFNAFFGMVTEAALAGLRADIAFVTCPAVQGRQAFHVDDTVVRAKRAMMAAATRCCLLVNHARFGHSALHLLADLSDFDWVITDAPPAPEARARLQRDGIALTIAGGRD